MQEQSNWWKTGIIYQIYPRSFKDSNGDGVGDLMGIMQRLEYVKSLNVDGIWISPIFPSPMHDFGYDVSNYTDIHPIFGTLDDFDRLLEQAHQLGLKILLDFVPNHTSDEHPWFLESRSSRENPKRDWYIWRDPKPDGSPPNNWLSSFGGSAWEWDEKTGQYYLHSFVKQQPDLNYRNLQVVQAMLDVMRFWLDRGVDGFRVDVITALVKDEKLLDEPENPNRDGVEPFNRLQHIYSNNHPDVHKIIRQMRRVMDEYDDRVMIGEIWGLSNEELIKYYGEHEAECHLPFNFGFIRVPWDAGIIRARIENYERILPKTAWPNWVIGNHDQHRIASRVGQANARVAHMLLLTLRGTPTAYFGDEIGMENVPIPPELVRDPPAVLQPEITHIVGRDPQRTPMQWNSSPNAGFSPAGVTPWLPVAKDYVIRNVAMQEANPNSMLSLFRALTWLHRTEPSLHSGSFRLISTGNDSNVLGYVREFPGADSFLILLNFTDQMQWVRVSQVAPAGELILCTDLNKSREIEFMGAVDIGPSEGWVVRLVR